MPETKPAIIHTDGACLGNPGPAGAGFIIKSADGAVLRQGSLALGHGTCNIAEYEGLIAALEAARELGLTHVQVRTDSELLCKQMTGRYRVRNSALRRLHAKARQLMQSFQHVAFEHVPRERNTQADALASEGAERARSRPPETGPPRLPF